MKSESADQEIVELERLTESFRHDLTMLHEILDLYEQEAVAMEMLEREERELLIDLEYGGESGLQRILTKIKSSFGLK